MSTTATEKEVQEKKVQKPVQTAAKKKPAEIDKELRAKYEDVELTLIDLNRIQWGVEGYSLSRIPDDNGSLQNTKKVPKNLPTIVLMIIDEAVQNRVLAPTSQLDKQTIAASGDVQAVQINEDVRVQELTQIDELLHLNEVTFGKQMQEMKKKGITKEFLETMLAEEERGKNRPGYVDLIKKFM